MNINKYPHTLAYLPTKQTKMDMKSHLTGTKIIPIFFGLFKHEKISIITTQTKFCRNHEKRLSLTTKLQIKNKFCCPK